MQVGVIYTLFASESDNYADIGDEVTLCSRESRMGRVWYIQGSKGMISWHAEASQTLELSERWLVANQYTAGGKLPPECFEYAK